MDIIKYICMGILLLVDIIIIIAVLLSSSKANGLSGLVSGGSETFFGKNKGNDIDAKLGKIIKLCGIVFVLLSIVLALLINHDWTASEDTAAFISSLLK